MDVCCRDNKKREFIVEMQVLWLRFLTEINERTQEAPAELLENPEVNEALKIVEVAAYSPAEMRAYDKFWDIISTAKTIELDRQEEARAYQQKIEQAQEELERVQAKVEQAQAQVEQAQAQAEQAQAEKEQVREL